MVHKRGLDCGFTDHGALIIPRAPRSIRVRRPQKKLVEAESLCAFELLADVAGKLLKDSEGSASSNGEEGKVQIHDGNEKNTLDDEYFKSESPENRSCGSSEFASDNVIQEHNLLSKFEGLQGSDVNPSSSPIISDASLKLDCGMALGVCEEQSSKTNSIGCGINPLSTGVQSNTELLCGSEVDLRYKNYDAEDLSTADNPKGHCLNTSSLVISDNSIGLPSYKESVSCALLQKHWSNVKLGLRDDDENSFGCKRNSTRIRPFRPQSHFVQQRIKKTVMSRYWKSAPKLKDLEGCRVKAFHQCRKSSHVRDGHQQAPIKKRKLFDNRFSYDCDTSNSISNKAYVCSKAHSKPKGQHVTVSIKSFKVPELYLEIPESATVGSLKRSVLEAVTEILGGGMRVGILFQGKKVRDDNRTLQQAGISQCSDLDNLGFTLEPSFSHMSSANPDVVSLSSLCDADQNTPRSIKTPAIDDSWISDKVAEHFAISNDVDIKDIVPFTGTDMPTDEDVPHAMALFPVSNMKVEPLTVVPASQKPKRTDASQRRTRRPFSVAEVEALVEAVEKLGTGRWRDVKMCAFEKADHRTYVDLKDKWKTLVHTASISPQQRRGEPVPQELLNRVLCAHSYWSQNQSKPHWKQQATETLKIEDSVVV